MTRFIHTERTTQLLDLMNLLFRDTGSLPSEKVHRDMKKFSATPGVNLMTGTTGLAPGEETASPSSPVGA